MNGRREGRDSGVRPKRTEEALAEREQQLSFAQELARLGSWEWELDTDRVTASPELAVLFGLDDHDTTIEEWLAMIAPEDAHAVERALRDLAAHGTPFDARFRIRRNGVTLFMHSRARRVGGEHEEPLHVIGVTQDVTTETLAQRALRDSEARYRELVAQVPGVVWSADDTGRIVFVSENIADLTGYAAEAFLEADEEFWAAAIHPDDFHALAEQWQANAGDGTPLDVEFRFRTKSGAAVWLHCRATMVDDAAGRRIVGVASDVSDRIAAETALRASEARYRSLVEQAKDIIVSLDAEGRVRSLNRAFEEVTGWSRAEWIGTSFFEALDEASRVLAAEQFGALLQGFEFPQATEFRLRKRDGTTITIEAFGRAVESGGKIGEIVVVARDVTMRKEDEARAEREKRLASLGQLAASVAHEFNNVLMSIMPFAELLQRRLPGDERVETATNHIIGAIRRGRQISREILRFAQPGEPTIETTVASEWLAEFHRKAQATLGPKFRVTADIPAPDVAFAADGPLLDQVATNLTLNARDAMPEGGELHIGVRREGSRVAIDFADRGTGIAPELLDRIFEPLYTTKRGGNGLGLTIAHQAMRQQNGSIGVRSSLGEGSTFTLLLPESAAPPRGLSVPGAASSRRVLIVEDDPSVGEGLRVLLADEGFEVHLVERGLQASEAIETFRPDLVLLDVNLPDISGLEVFDTVQARWPSLPVIFSTGHADARALASRHARRVPSIMKPYDIEELLAVIRTVAP